MVGNLSPPPFLSTFGGGIRNSGTIRLSGASGVGIDIVNVSSVSGGITNSGTISRIGIGAIAGIAVGNVTNFAGDIVNNGNISTFEGIELSIRTLAGDIINSGTISTKNQGIQFDNASTFAGAIINSGTIAAASNTGISIGDVFTFAGGITNTGTITAGADFGIFVRTIAVFGSTSAGGDIVNSGTISLNESSPSAPFIGGIGVAEVTSFAGDISNAGSISAGKNPAIEVVSVSTFSGNITNASGGTIHAQFQGIVIGGPAAGVRVFGRTRGGGIVNNGTISTTSRSGIEVQDVSTFLGGITNTGTISAGVGGKGIAIDGGTFSGDIVNTGVVSGFDGIGVSSVAVFGSASAIGAITNTGTIAGNIGILVGFAPVRLFDLGDITGTLGNAVEFQTAGGPNTLTLGPGYNISGNVLGSGSDILQLGGTGSGSFDLSSAGAGRQYTGFSTFNVIGGTWTVSGSGKDWNVDGGALHIAAGGVLSSATVSSGGTLAVLSGGFAGPTAIHNGGTLIIDGGTADLQSGATVSAPITFVSTGGTLEIAGSAAVLSAFMSGLVVSGLCRRRHHRPDQCHLCQRRHRVRFAAPISSSRRAEARMRCGTARRTVCPATPSR